MKDELDRLFQERDERADKAAAAAQIAKEKAEELRAQALRVITDVVAPVLREFEAELRSRGHGCTASIGESFSTPRATLNFKLAADDPRKSIPESTFTMIANPMVSITSEIWTSKGKTSSSGAPLKPLLSIDQEWVRSQVLAFVSRVIKGA
ncbi:MAG: hypothetical protein ACKVIS_08950 [Pseudomonadales bacterium]